MRSLSWSHSLVNGELVELAYLPRVLSKKLRVDVYKNCDSLSGEASRGMIQSIGLIVFSSSFFFGGCFSSLFQPSLSLLSCVVLTVRI